MEIKVDKKYLRMRVRRDGQEHPTSAAELEVEVAAGAPGFAGRAQVKLEAFSLWMWFNELMDLEESAEGEARLESKLPGELMLCVEPAGQPELFAVSGCLGSGGPGENADRWQGLVFAFPFDGALLRRFISSLGRNFQSG